MSRQRNRARIRATIAATVVTAACVVAARYFHEECSFPVRSWPAAQSAPDWMPGVLLPDVTGLRIRQDPGVRSGSIKPRFYDDVVVIDATGRSSFADVRARPAAYWPGLALTVKKPDLPGVVLQRRQEETLWISLSRLHSRSFSVTVYRLNQWRAHDIREVAAMLHRLKEIGQLTLKVDTPADEPLGNVLATTAVGAAAGHVVEIPPLVDEREIVDTREWVGFREKCRRLAEYCRRRDAADSDLRLLVRADCRAPWHRVDEVLGHCRAAGIHHVAFSVVADGREVALMVLDREIPVTM